MSRSRPSTRWEMRASCTGGRTRVGTGAAAAATGAVAAAAVAAPAEVPRLLPLVHLPVSEEPSHVYHSGEVLGEQLGLVHALEASRRACSSGAGGDRLHCALRSFGSFGSSLPQSRVVARAVPASAWDSRTASAGTGREGASCRAGEVRDDAVGTMAALLASVVFILVAKLNTTARGRQPSK